MFTNNHTNRYRITFDGNKTTATASFAGKDVYGYAKCNTADGDAFSEDFGTDLATLRCAEKINKKRVRNAKKKYADALAAAKIANENLARMTAYLKDAEAETKEIEDSMKKLLGSIK